MAKHVNKRLERVKKILDYGLNHETVTVSAIAKEFHNTANKYITDYIEIIDYISKNPVDIEVMKINNITYLKFKKK